jgi:hypothetical protein
MHRGILLCEETLLLFDVRQWQWFHLGETMHLCIVFTATLYYYANSWQNTNQN